MVLSPDSRQAARPEQEAVVPAGSACEEGGAGGRKEWPQRLGLSWAIVQPGHCGAALSNAHWLLQPAGPRSWSCGVAEVRYFSSPAWSFFRK